MMQVVEYRTFGAAPERRDQKIFRSVTGHTVDDKIRGKMIQTGDQKIEIFFPGERLKLSGKIIIGKIRAFEYVKQLQFVP